MIQEPQPTGKNQPKRPRNFLEVLMANRERKETRKQETRPDSNPQARHTSTPVRRRVQRLEEKLQNSNRMPKRKRGLEVQ